MILLTYILIQDFFLNKKSTAFTQNIIKKKIKTPHPASSFSYRPAKLKINFTWPNGVIAALLIVSINHVDQILSNHLKSQLVLHELISNGYFHFQGFQQFQDLHKVMRLVKAMEGHFPRVSKPQNTTAAVNGKS